MKVALLHLTDIHFSKDKPNQAASRYDEIVAATTSISSDVSAYFIVVTGDIANWGLSIEYKIAKDFFTNLLDSFKSIPKNTFTTSSLIFVPGNHDCDFSSDKDLVEVRNAVLESIPQKLSDLTSSSGLVKQALSIQSNFFKFVSELSNNPILSEEKQIFYSYKKLVKGKQIDFHCFNTAWLSQIKERQGQLLYPVKIAENLLKDSESNSDLVISLFHHPYNWLEESNARNFTRLVEQTSDVILTGHEHVEDSFLKVKDSGENIRYFAGSVLQEHGTSKSGFSVILIDLDKQKQKRVNFKWDKNLYKSKEGTDWIPFTRNSFLISEGFLNNEEFSRYLQDIGTEYLHPYKLKGTLVLSDLFVYPDMKELSVGSKTLKDTIVRGENILNNLIKSQFSIIYGEDNSGKTSLAKKLYKDFQGKELVPLIISSKNNLSEHDDDSIRKGLDEAIEEQYSNSLKDKFYQLSSKKRVLIIDDIHKFSLNNKSKRSLLENAQQIFGTIVVFANDIYQFHAIVEQDQTSKALFNFNAYKIRESGRKLRGQIIRRWLSLGRETIIEPRDISYEEQELEHVLNSIISKNMIPAYPFWIISILQMWKSENSSNGNFGAFGYIFDGLITKQLENLGYDATKIDKIYTFLGRIAYYLFENKQEELTYNNLERINDDYYKLYKVRLRLSELINKLVEIRILRESDNKYYFSQSYIYYFFVARYIRENLAARVDVEKLRNKVFEMISQISYEPYSYILLILVYLTKDRKFIEKIIEHSKQIYSELTPCDLNDSVNFLNEMSPQLKPITISSNNFEINRDEYRENIDEIDEDSESDESPQSSNNIVTYNDNLDYLNKLIIAMRTLDLMGQILRNFPGSLFADLKYELTKESYLLGLRTLQSFLKLARDNFEDFREYYSKVIKEKRGNSKDTELELAADSLLLWLTSGASFGVIKRISIAVGHEDLIETYSEVKRNLGKSLSIDLIDLSIKLEHFKGIPNGDINYLRQETKENKFTFGLLRDLISHFLYLFPVDEKDRQRLAANFEINIPTTRLLLNDSKRDVRRKSKKRKKK